MELPRLGAFSSSRLSFARSLIRKMARQRWQVTQTRFDLNADGYGEVIYRIQTPQARYHVVIFSRYLDDAQRSDRVIAEAWDLTFGLVEGDVEDDLMMSLSENVPLQEAGRQHPNLLVISRANRSVRNFSSFVEQLSQGRQPAESLLKTAGYLYRTTAVYGNGKFGIADFARLKDNPDFRQPFSAQMTAVYVLRQFSIDQVEHIARNKSPDAVPLSDDLKRYVGIGNSTGLGMAPFLINHPLLINQWVHMRETALSLAKQEAADEEAQQRLLDLMRRAIQSLQECDIENDDQRLKNEDVVSELSMAAVWLDQVSAEADLWLQLTDWAEAAFTLETQELINTLLIEIYPDHTDGLEDYMAAEESLDLVPDMPLIQLKQLIETYLDWALQVDLTSSDERYWFWYRSIEKEEPRLGIRGVDEGEEKELSIAIGPRVQRIHATLDAHLRQDPAALTIDFLMANQRDSDIVRRIQTMAGSAYGEIRANLWHREMKPMHLLRAKLSFLGAQRFDPKGDRWVRVTFFQGAPLIAELNAEPVDLVDFDDWSFALAPQRPRR
ncbi:MAG: hypothetical protein CNE43_02250 [Halieaceae bacterium MED-G26]|nr:MAG: hypothetical protein CNE43_02250 [Halieaceae bacterium MED-G26]